jgi:hypothetical protein
MATRKLQTPSDVAMQYEIRLSKGSFLADFDKVSMPALLKSELQYITHNYPYTISEAVIRETILFPILKALRKNNPNAFTIYSGEVLNADRRKGLYGECDIYIDKRKYYLNEIAELLGRFQYIINSY